MLAGLPSTTKDESAYQMFSRLLQIREATIQKGHITVTDEGTTRRRPDDQAGIGRNGAQSLSRKGPRRPAYFRGAADHRRPLVRFPDRHDQSERSSSSLAAEEPYSVHPAFQFEARSTRTTCVCAEAADFFGPRPVPHNCRAVLVSKAISAWPGCRGCDVVLTQIAANVDELAVTGKANMAGLLTSQPTFSITFAAPSIDLRQLFARIPAQWIHAQLPALVERRNWAAPWRSSPPP